MAKLSDKMRAYLRVLANHPDGYECIGDSTMEALERRGLVIKETSPNSMLSSIWKLNPEKLA